MSLVGWDWQLYSLHCFRYVVRREEGGEFSGLGLAAVQPALLQVCSEGGREGG